MKKLGLFLAIILSSMFFNSQVSLAQKSDDHKNFYYVEFGLMEEFMSVYYEEKADVEEYTDLSGIANIFREDNPEITQIIESVKAEVFETKKSEHVIVYTFPEPKETPLAKYGAIYLPADTTNTPRYFTLEKTMNFGGDNYWVLGEKEDGSHINHGFFNECKTPKDFYELVIKMLKKK